MAALAHDGLGKITPRSQGDGRLGEAGEIKISVVIPCYNAAGSLGNAIDSVLKQGIDNTEILVVDDASTDETLAVAHRLARERPKICVLRHTRNGGVAKARNTGFREATGQYVCFLDADDTYGDGVFATALAVLESSPWIQAVDFPIEMIDCHRAVHPTHLLMVANSSASNLLARRQVIQMIGGFPEGSTFRRKHGGEDIAFRMALRSWGNIHRLGGISLKYTFRPGGHFDAFLDNTRIENNTVKLLKNVDSDAVQEGILDHLAAVRQAIRREVEIGATQSIEWNRGKQRRRIEVFQNPASLKRAVDTLAGRTYPRIPSLTGINSVLDVGANIGASAIFFASQFADARIVAIEPARAPYVLLRCNTQSDSKIAAYNVGFLEKPIKGVVHDTLPEGIHLVAADAFVKQVGMDQPDIIKLDAGGWEVPILRSILGSARGAKAIYLGYHQEEDRLQFDRMFADTHVLAYAKIMHPHRGDLVYVRGDAFPSGESQTNHRSSGRTRAHR